MSKGEISIGPAGWFYKDWIGIVYPLDRRAIDDRLVFLSRFFSCIEINTTFYRIPSPKTTESWVRKVSHSRDFLFTVKMWRGFTHEGKEEFTKKQCSLFNESILPIREAGRLGAVLVQFPWFFRPSVQSWERLSKISDFFAGLPLVLEVRNRQWTERDALRRISSLGYSICNIDQPIGRDSLGPSSIITGSIGYVRLHGRNEAAWFSSDAERDEKYDYLYERNEILEWISLISKMRNCFKMFF